ncbi:MAG: ABC transporter permease [Acidobacteriales bacterium]|nr:ABC transporter permease [Terriglobales bacterium]
MRAGAVFSGQSKVSALAISYKIAAEGVSLGTSVREAWRCRHLVTAFAWRDIKVRYKQTVLGAAWAIIQPLTTMGALSLVFARFAKLSSGGVPYPLFVLSGLVLWQFFANAVTRASRSLVDERYMLTRVYLPRVLVPLAAVASGAPDVLVACAMLGILTFVYRVQPTAMLLSIPLLLLLTAVLAGAVGLVLAAINARYRDVGITIPLLMQLWFLLTPVAYPADIVPGRWRLILSLNPVARPR